MKKLVMTVAVLACVASVASAQTVSSANIVGYNKDASPAGLHIAAYPFQSDDTTPAGVFGDQLPVGTQVFVYNGTSYQSSTYGPYTDPNTFLTVTGWNPNVIDLSGSAGFWVSSASASSAVLSGEVPMDDSITTPIAIGLQLLSVPYPVETAVEDLFDTVNGDSPSNGDRVFVYDVTTSAYKTSVYGPYTDPNTFMTVIGWNPTLTISVGQGFWYSANANISWVCARPFNP